MEAKGRGMSEEERRKEKGGDEELANTRTFFPPSEGWKEPLVY
jgi:hypothetical protein